MPQAKSPARAHDKGFALTEITTRLIEVEGITISRYADGMVTSNHVQRDKLGVMRQIGVVPLRDESAWPNPSGAPRHCRRTPATISPRRHA